MREYRITMRFVRNPSNSDGWTTIEHALTPEEASGQALYKASLLHAQGGEWMVENVKSIEIEPFQTLCDCTVWMQEGEDIHSPLCSSVVAGQVKP